MTATRDKVITRLEEANIAAAATVAARAFANDPMFAYVFPNARERFTPLRRFMTAALRYGVLFGEVATTNDTAGVALWLTPNQTTVTPARMLRAGMAFLPLTIGVAAFRRFLTFVSYGEQVLAQVVREPFWHLLDLAVDPPLWRQGIGSALIAPVLARADQNGQPCYLETNNPSNLPFYAQHGFAIAHTGQVPNGGPAFWSLLRTPQKPNSNTRSLLNGQRNREDLRHHGWQQRDWSGYSPGVGAAWRALGDPWARQTNAR